MQIKLKSYIYTIIVVISIIIVSSCGPSKGYLAGASAYQDEEQLWDPAYRIYHLSDNTTRFYFIIPPGDMLYVRNPKTYKFEASTEISYKIVTGKSTLLTTGVVEINREEDEIPTEALIGFFDVEIPKGKFYFAKLIIDDKLRKKQFVDILTINKTNLSSKENFIITDTTNRVVFMDYINPNKKTKISSERIKASRLFVTKYTIDNTYPSPIYIETESKKSKIRIDTSFSILADQYVSFKEKGIYLISKDSLSTIGLTLLNFYDGFPLIAQKNNIAPPLRYITSDEEFNALQIGTESSKLKAEKLWSSMTNNLPSTEKILTTYYKRIQYSNIYFTSYKEGWKTDRGLVYTIFGQPSNIYKNTREEKWSYGRQDSELEFNFVFVKRRNILTDNDYTLIRDRRMKDIWQKAVEHWRSGRVFDNSDIIRIQDEASRQRNDRSNFYYPSYRRF